MVPLTATEEFRVAIPVVYGYLLRRCGSVSVAEDLTQETFIAAVRALRAGVTDATSPQWLVGVARHKLVDHYRRHGREARRLERLALERGDAVADSSHGEVLSDRTLAALLALPPMQRAALVLRYMDDLSVPETARMLGRSIHATESLLSRGRAGLRRLLSDEERHDG